MASIQLKVMVKKDLNAMFPNADLNRILETGGDVKKVIGSDALFDALSKNDDVVKLDVKFFACKEAGVLR